MFWTCQQMWSSAPGEICKSFYSRNNNNEEQISVSQGQCCGQFDHTRDGSETHLAEGPSQHDMDAQKHGVRCPRCSIHVDSPSDLDLIRPDDSWLLHKGCNQYPFVPSRTGLALLTATHHFTTSQPINLLPIQVEAPSCSWWSNS